MSVVPVTPIRQRRHDDEEWLTAEQVCERVPVLTPRDLEDMRSAGKGPAYSRPTPRKVVYAWGDVRSWLNGKRVTTREQS